MTNTPSYPLKTALSVSLIIAILALSPGCTSSARAIGKSAQSIQTQARGIKTDLDQATDTGEVGDAARPFVDSARGRAGKIEKEAIEVQSRIPDIRDRTHPLIALMQTWGWIILILAIIALLIYLGVGPLFRRGLNFFGLLIPRATRDEARMDARTVYDTSADSAMPQEQVRRIENRKQSDPAYRSAFKKETSAIQ